MRPHAILDQSGSIYLQGKAVTIDCHNRADAESLVDWLLGIDAEHPNATDYRNRGERDAAYWRELCERLISRDVVVQYNACTEAELARINTEALR